MEDENWLVKERKEKLERIRQKGVNPYPYSFEQLHHAKDVNEKYSGLKKEEETKDRVKAAGRIIAMRRMGKATFMHILDSTGKLQLYFRQDDIGKEKYKFLKLLDMGDFIGAEGRIFKTRTGEVTVFIEKFDLLAKSLRPLPEKFHGLQDPEARHRMRYVDLIANPEVRDVFVKRAAIISAIREFLDSRGFLEVETPVLQPIYGGANARPFTTMHNALKMKLYLRISNELYLKRLVVGGLERVYEISKDFRNEGIDTRHNPEFTMLEFYCAYVDYNEMMKMTEELWAFAANKVMGTTKVEYQGKTIDLKPPWERMTMAAAIKKYVGIDAEKEDEISLKEIIKKNRLEIEGDFTRGRAMQAIFEGLAEEKLAGPVFITDHPRETTPLCKEKRGNPELVERVEPFICGMEVGNGYSELNDPIRQRKELEEQAGHLSKGNEEAHPMDEDFVKAIEFGMPPTGGMGVGIDRMVMIMTNKPSIREVITFPTLRAQE